MINLKEITKNENKLQLQMESCLCFKVFKEKKIVFFKSIKNLKFNFIIYQNSQLSLPIIKAYGKQLLKHKALLAKGQLKHMKITSKI